MQLTLLTLSAALASFVSAQTVSVPTCAQSCISDLLPTSCNGNPQCICSNSEFINNIACCVYEACSEADQQQALTYAQSFCTPAGVTTLPSSAGCAAGVSTSFAGVSVMNTPTAGASSGSATESGSTSTMTSGASSASSMASSAASSAASVASSASSAASSKASSAASAASSAAASATSSAAAGEKLTAQGLSLFGAIFGAVALL